MKIYNNSKAFTLIEVLIAMAIFAIGILGVVKLQITSTGDNTKSRLITEGATVAVDEIEMLIISSYQDNKLGAATTTLSNPVNVGSGEHGESDGADYTVTREIKDDTPIKSIKHINVTTQWGNASKGKTFTATTYKAEKSGN